MEVSLNSLFAYGTLAIYTPCHGQALNCRVFVDVGWHDNAHGFGSHVGHPITLISVLLQEIPIPRSEDSIVINDEEYCVLSIYSQDAAIAVLQVRKK